MAINYLRGSFSLTSILFMLCNYGFLMLTHYFNILNYCTYLNMAFYIGLIQLTNQCVNLSCESVVVSILLEINYYILFPVSI